VRADIIHSMGLEEVARLKAEIIAHCAKTMNLHVRPPSASAAGAPSIRHSVSAPSVLHTPQELKEDARTKTGERAQLCSARAHASPTRARAGRTAESEPMHFDTFAQLTGAVCRSAQPVLDVPAGARAR
jgi:hypothetical protein